MAATALIKLTQNLISNGPGFVLVGTAADGPVTVENGDNTGVASWQIDLVYTAPGSAVLPATPLAFNNNDSTPTASFTPDVPGCYRLVLRLWSTTNRLGPPADVDIRNFVILTPNKGLVIPPYQKDPDPLPTLASGKPGAKPNELNINAFELGWAGDGETDGLMNQLVAEVDLGTGGASGLPSILTAKDNDVLTANDFVPNLNFPTAAVFDGTDVWVLKANFALFAISSTTPQAWGVARINPVTNKYLESVDAGNPGFGGPLSGLTLVPFDVATKMLWTGTQLFVFGINAQTADPFVQEVLRGSGAVPTTFGPRLSMAFGPPDFVIAATWDGSKIWAATVGGNLYRIDPSTPATPELFLPVSTGLSDVIYDPDGTPYPDTLPRIYAADGATIFRVKDISTLTPSVDATDSSTATTKMFLGAGFLYGGESGAISRFIREPLALDFQVGGPTFPLGAVYDPVTNKGFFSFVDNTTQNPTVARLSTALVVESTVVLNANSFSAIPFATYDMAVISAMSSVFVPEEGVSSAGNGDVYKVNTGTLAAAAASTDLALRYGIRSKVQYIVNPGAPATLIWDGFSDVIAVALPVVVAPISIEIGLGVEGKRVTITDFFGTADSVNSISFTALGSPLNGDGGPIVDAYGSVTLVGTGVGAWAVEARSPAAPTASGVPISNVRFVDLNTSVVVGNDGTPERPYQTITTALLSLPGPSILFIAPGDYSGEGVISFNVSALGAVSLVNMSMGAPISAVTTPSMVVLAGVNAFGSGTEPLTVVGIECPAFSANCAVLATDCKLFVFGGGGVGDYVVRSHGFLGQFGGTYHSLRAYGVTIDNSVQGLTDGAGSFDGYGTELYNCRFSNVGDLITNHNNVVRMVGTFLPFGAVNISFVNPAGLEMDGFTNFYWTQLEDGGLATLTGAVQHLTTRGNVYSTVNLTLGPTADDLTGMGVRNATNLDITPDPGGTTLTGIVSLLTFRVDYLYKKMLVNVGPGTLTLENEGAGSTAANRFRIPGGGNVILNPDDTALIDYDLNINRWRVITALAEASVPLTNTFYVDAGSASVTETGTDETPFKTLTAAVAAVQAGGVGGTILVVPGNYTGEATISYSATGGQNLSIASLSNGDATYGQDTLLPNLNLSGSSGYVSLTGIQCSNLFGTVVDPALIIASRCTIVAFGYNSYDVRDTFLDTSGATALGSVQATDSTILTDLTCTFISMRGGAVQGNITCTGTEATLLDLDPGTLKSVTFTPDQGTLIIDPATYSQFVKKGNTLNNGFFDILKPQAFTIETPTITANQDDYTTDDWGNADHVRLNPNGGQFNITGFDSNIRTRRKTLTNVSSTGSIVLVHEDAGSAAANRIALPNPTIETTYLIPESRTVEIYYNTIAGRWQVIQALSELLTVNDTPSAGNNNDYVIGGFPGARADVIRIITTNVATITGISATFGSGMDVGRTRKTLINVGPNPITLTNQDGSSAGANQFKIPGGDLVLGVDESVDIYYDKTDFFWRVL